MLLPLFTFVALNLPGLVRVHGLMFPAQESPRYPTASLFISTLELRLFAELAVFVLAHFLFAPLDDTTHLITSKKFMKCQRLIF